MFVSSSVYIGRIIVGDIYFIFKCYKDISLKGELVLGQQILKVDLEDVSINVVVNL